MVSLCSPRAWKKHTLSLELGLHCHIHPCGVLGLDELLAKLEEVSTLFSTECFFVVVVLFVCFVFLEMSSAFDIFISQYGKFALKAAGICAH